MDDNDMVEPYAVREIYVDGFTQHVARDGVMTCVGYRNMPDGKIVVVRLAWPAVNTTHAIDEANAALTGNKQPAQAPARRSGAKPVH